MKDFDELLDEVLREDAQAAPLTGLESRVMARMRTEGRSRNWLRGWMLVPAAACLGVVAMVWFVAGRGAPQNEVVVSRASTQLTPKAEMSSRESGRALRDAHLSRDRAAAKMGHPALVANRRAVAVPVRESMPKLETFPAVTQKGEATSWLGGSGDSKLVAIAKDVSPQALKAYQELQASQNGPINIAAIEIKPLQ